VNEDRFPRCNPAPIARKMLSEGVQPVEKLHGSMPWSEAPALLSKLVASDKPQARGLQFLLLCCTPRTAEVLGARWPEMIDDQFHVPAVRMKSGKARIIPLSEPARALLADLRRQTNDGGFIFGSRCTIDGKFVPLKGEMQKDVMNKLFRKIMPGVDAENGQPWNVHGLRSTFRAWVGTHAQNFDDNDAAETALDHVLGTKVARVYDRGPILEQRLDLADRWGRFLSGDIAH
jgi:integrase